MHKIIFFLRLFVFWLIYFFVNRLFFILFYYQEFSSSSFIELFMIVSKSLRLDLSFIAYLSVIFVILLFLNSFVKKNKFNLFISRVIFFVNIFFILITSLIVGGEIAIYSEWGTKLNFTAISHFINPSEVFLTATFQHYIIVLISLAISFLFIKFYKKYIHHLFLTEKEM